MIEAVSFIGQPGRNAMFPVRAAAWTIVNKRSTTTGSVRMSASWISRLRRLYFEIQVESEHIVERRM